MKDVAGWWCPDLLSGPGSYLGRFDVVHEAFEFTKGRRSCIQAGGHIGTYPVRLAALFDVVYSFEPDEANFRCLVANLERWGVHNVFAFHACLGHTRGPVGLYQSTKSTGQHFVRGSGHVPVLHIDDLGLHDVDFILLDVEGFEIPALFGAEETIARCAPVVMAEENKRAVGQGFQIGDLARWFESRGYWQARHIGEDKIFAKG